MATQPGTFSLFSLPLDLSVSAGAHSSPELSATPAKGTAALVHHFESPPALLHVTVSSQILASCLSLIASYRFFYRFLCILLSGNSISFLSA